MWAEGSCVYISVRFMVAMNPALLTFSHAPKNRDSTTEYDIMWCLLAIIYIQQKFPLGSTAHLKDFASPNCAKPKFCKLSKLKAHLGLGTQVLLGHLVRTTKADIQYLLSRTNNIVWGIQASWTSSCHLELNLPVLKLDSSSFLSQHGILWSREAVYIPVSHTRLPSSLSFNPECLNKNGNGFYSGSKS